MKKENYFEQRALSCEDKIDRILKELPYFCETFFVGIGNTTSPLTRLNYAYDLRVFFDFLAKKVFKVDDFSTITLENIEEIDSSDIELYLNYLNRYKYNGKICSCNEYGKARKLATVRSFYKYLFNKNKISTNVAAKVSMPKLHDKEIIRLDAVEGNNEVAKLIDTVETGYGLTKKQLDFHKKNKIRDSAIITLFLGTGIRISELVGLNVEDINFTSNSFVVTRKGGNRAILYFNDEVKYALESYLEERKVDDNKNDKQPALFLGTKGRISVRTVQEIVKKYAKIVSPLKKITPHKLRSTFGTNLYRSTKDIYIVADCLGHNDVNTTKKHYAAITEDIRKNAASTIKLK
ncbi:MAG: integrase [Clostridiales bacterium]|nr:integrase [Clostridiales bacterium]